MLRNFLQFLNSNKKNDFQTSTLRPSNEKLRDYTRYLLDKIPFPAWIRSDEDLTLSYCNTAYAAALETSPQDAIEGNLSLHDQDILLARRALESGNIQNETHTLVLQGKRKLMELTEIPVVNTHAVVGYAIDHSPIELLQQELDRHNAAHFNILGYLNNAIAIYDTQKYLQFYNKAFLKLWRLNQDFLDKEPRFDEVLEELRTHRRIPEQADFPGYKRDMMLQFQTLLTPKQEIVHLPDERIIRQSILPHPLGGLMFIYENITDNIALQRQNTVLTDTFEASLNCIHHPILIINADRQLTFANQASIDWAGINLKDPANLKKSFYKVLESLPKDKQPNDKEKLIKTLSAREDITDTYNKKFNYKIERIPYGNNLLQLVAS